MAYPSGFLGDIWSVFFMVIRTARPVDISEASTIIHPAALLAEAILLVAEAVLAAVGPLEAGNMMKTKTLAEKFLTAAEQQKVTEVVRDAERTLSGEIVPMIVSRNHDYQMAAITCAVSMTQPSALLLANLIGKRSWIGSQNMCLFLGLFTAIYLLLYLLAAHSDRLKHFFPEP